MDRSTGGNAGGVSWSGRNAMRLNRASGRRRDAGGVDRLADFTRDLCRWGPRAPARTAVAHRLLHGGGSAECGVIILHGHCIVIDVANHEVTRFHEAPIGVVRLDDDCAADRWQWRPAHVASPITPRDPGRRPRISRYPHPTVALIQVPAAVMERSPAPLPIALIGPAVIRVHPVPAGAVRSEADSHYRRARSPNPAVAPDIDPFSVRSERGDKDIG